MLTSTVADPAEWDLRDLDRRAEGAALPAPEELLIRFAPYCRRLIRRYGTTYELRQDLLGELYCILHDLIQNYDTSRGVPLSAYLFTQLRASIFTSARREWRFQRREVAVSPLEEDWWEFQSAGCDAPAERILLRESLLDAMGQLTERQRAVVYLRYFQDREFEEIAEILGIQPVSARSLLRNGLARLRKILRNELRDRSGERPWESPEEKPANGGTADPVR